MQYPKIKNKNFFQPRLLGFLGFGVKWAQKTWMGCRICKIKFFGSIFEKINSKNFISTPKISIAQNSVIARIEVRLWHPQLLTTRHKLPQSIYQATRAQVNYLGVNLFNLKAIRAIRASVCQPKSPFNIG